MECGNDTPVDDCCNVWQADNLKIPKLDQPARSDHDNYHQFFIKFEVELIYPPVLPIEDEEDYVLVVESELESRTSYQHFWAPCRRLDRQNLSWDDISTMLTKMGVPMHKQPSMLHRISACADQIANADHNKDRNILPMMVSISIVADCSCYDHQENERTLVRRDNGEGADSMMPVPAGKESDKGLKKEIAEDQEKGSVKQCMICLEKIEVVSEIMGMPCSHVYHEDCILHWLKISNFCPLCRLQLPD